MGKNVVSDEEGKPSKTQIYFVSLYLFWFWTNLSPRFFWVSHIGRCWIWKTDEVEVEDEDEREHVDRRGGGRDEDEEDEEDGTVSRVSLYLFFKLFGFGFGGLMRLIGVD